LNRCTERENGPESKVANKMTVSCCCKEPAEEGCSIAEEVSM
jgi:hypothetical protein